MENASKKYVQMESASQLRIGHEFEAMPIADILYGVERHVRNLCQAMEVVRLCNPSHMSIDDRDAMFNTFCMCVDNLMNPITTLRDHLDEFEGVSLERLRFSKEFRVKILGRECFKSDEEYEAYVRSFDGVGPQGRSLADLLRATEEAEAKEKKLRTAKMKRKGGRK